MEDAIKKRYSILAEDTCCLACGGALEKSEARAGEICIDLGSGRGNDVIKLADIVGPNGYVYGIDATPEMIAKATRTAEKLDIVNAGFILSGLEEIPISSERADLIISNCVLNHVSGKDKAWKEIYRLLKKGGRFVISDIYSIDAVPSEYSSNPVAIAECWAGAVTREEYLENIREAGFNSVDIVEESQPYKKGKINVCSFTIKGVKQ